MVAAWPILAQAHPPADHRLWEDPRFIWTVAAFIGLLFLGAIVLAVLDRWRKRSGSPSLSANDQLAHFRELYENGELSQSEFERIRARLTGQLMRELDVRPRPTDTAGPPEPPAPPSPPAGV
jgi:hypothetical protein